MYFEFEEYKPDITPVGSVISWREGVLLSIIVHLAGVILVLMSPQIFEVNRAAILARQAAIDAAPKDQDAIRLRSATGRSESAEAPRTGRTVRSGSGTTVG